MLLVKSRRVEVDVDKVKLPRPNTSQCVTAVILALDKRPMGKAPLSLFTWVFRLLELERLHFHKGCIALTFLSSEELPSLPTTPHYVSCHPNSEEKINGKRKQNICPPQKLFFPLNLISARCKSPNNGKSCEEQFLYILPPWF